MDSSTSRRNFLKTALTLPAALAVGPSLLSASAETPPASTQPAITPIPTRALGRSGRQVSMAALGGDIAAYSPEYLDIAWSMGIRYFDNADCYINRQSEQRLGAWLAKYPERRKEMFIVSKDHPRQGVQQMLQMIDTRLAAIGTDHLDLFFIHGINPREYGDQSLTWPKSDDFKRVADQLKNSGKVKMVGFSCHDDWRAAYLTSAAQGGFLDAIMVKYTPFFTKGDPFDTALDACHQAGIGLIAMKTMRNTRDVPTHVPDFDKMGIDVHQAILHAVWSDKRISAACISMDNVAQMGSVTDAARAYKKPLQASHIEILRDLVMGGRRTMCPGCEACDSFGATAALAYQDIARFVTYYEHDGNLAAGEMFRSLAPAQRDFSSVDLAGLRDRCAFQTDYPEIMKRAQRYFV
jgi:predicted aldo/keto reductase-like oxidoreductase